MEKPLCKICRARHWSNDRCLGLKEDKPEKPLAAPSIKEQIAKVAAIPDDKIDTSDIPEVKDWSGAERGRFAKAPAPTPKKSASEKTAACPELHGQKEKPAIVVGYNFKAAAECPVCAERKRKKSAQMKRYRQRKKEEE